MKIVGRKSGKFFKMKLYFSRNKKSFYFYVSCKIHHLKAFKKNLFRSYIYKKCYHKR